MVQSLSNYDELANVEEKIKTGKIIQEYKEMEIDKDDNKNNNNNENPEIDSPNIEEGNDDDENN